MIDKLGRGFTLETEHTAVGMIGVGLEPNYFAIRNRRNGGAVRCAKSALPAHGMCGLIRMNHRLRDYSAADSLSTPIFFLDRA